MMKIYIFYLSMCLNEFFSIKFSGEIFDSMMKIYIFYLFFFFKMNIFSVKFNGEIFDNMLKIYIFYLSMCLNEHF